MEPTDESGIIDVSFSPRQEVCFIIAFLLMAGVAGAAENPCYHPGHSQSVPHDKSSILTIEASRVRAIGGKAFTYDLGRETITVIADSVAARQFMNEVSEHRCGAHAAVRLDPVRKSPFNTTFKARCAPQ